MAQFVHFASDRSIASIRRVGLRKGKGRQGVYAVPVTPDFYRSHQWLRELLIHNPGPLHAVYFRLAGTAPVLFGTYRDGHVLGTADAAAGFLMAMDQPLGFEAILLEAVSPDAITSIKPMRQVTGWRYFPGAKGRKPCGCPVCLRRGEPFSQKIRRKFAID